MPGRKYSRSVHMKYGQWAGSKWTNQNQYDPWDLEITRVDKKLFGKIDSASGVVVFQMEAHPEFITPLEKEDVDAMLERLPSEYTDELEAIVLLGGSKKQLASARSGLTYGCYTWSRRIYIHAFPKKYLVRRYESVPKPSVLNEYRKAGAVLRKNGSTISVVFDRAALKTFFLREVLMHEIGHHVDRENFSRKTNKKAEGFADWFASEYGYRRRI